MGGEIAKSECQIDAIKTAIPPTTLSDCYSAPYQRSRVLDRFYAHHRAFIRYIRYTSANIRCVSCARISCISLADQPAVVYLVCAEIQELRHKSQGSSDASGANNEIDQLLVSLDERLASVSKGVKAVTEALEPILSRTPVPSRLGADGEVAVIVRKHAALTAEWEAAKAESETLRDELKEDKWLIVFRTVTEQAGGLMSSLEKGVNRCQVCSNRRLPHTSDLHLRFNRTSSPKYI